jgi:predicted metal-dependent RNase
MGSGFSPLVRRSTWMSRPASARRSSTPVISSAPLRWSSIALKAINQKHGPMVIIAASGMAESGRILHHLRNGAADSRNTILVVGFMAEGTL